MGGRISASVLLVAAAGWLAVAPAVGALRVHPDNPRWLTEDGGKTALVLTGAHTWSLFQDLRGEDEFEAAAYLDGLATAGHNFTRGWFWEDGFYSPLPYVLEGGKYRLSPPYSRDYVDRLRSRVRAARKRGLYVSVMLFQGWSLADQGGQRTPNPWPQNPYNRDNHREQVSKQHAALHIGLAQEQQLDYVAFVAKRLCSEPNLVWEISNESHPNSLGEGSASNWQAGILAHLKKHCGRRLTWVSCPATIEQSEALRQELIDKMHGMEVDLVSPCDPHKRYTRNPPAADGRKVIIADSDHLALTEVDGEWAWKAFLRGQHPILMDLGESLSWWTGPDWDPADRRWGEVRAALGSIQELVAAVNRSRAGAATTGLGAMAPQSGPGGGAGARTRPATSAWTLFSSDRPCKRKRAGAKCRTARANGGEILSWAGAGETVRFCRLESAAEYRLRWKKPLAVGYHGPVEVARADASGCLEAENPAGGFAVAHLEREL